MILVAAKFIICFSIVVALGIRLSKYADVLSKKSVFSEYIMGIFFLSVVTSFPEIFTNIGAVKLVFAPDMATADIIGSIIFNLTIIAFLDVGAKQPLLLKASKVHIITAVFTVAMLCILTWSLLMNYLVGARYSVFNIDLSSVVLVILYLWGIGLVYKKERAFLKGQRRTYINVKGVWIKFAITSIILIISSLWLAKIGKEIVDKTNLTEIFVGGILLAITTSLPEIVITATALKIGSVDLALGNILGSNLFNLLVIPICDVVVRRGPLISFLSGEQIFPASVGIVLTIIVIMGIRIKKKRVLFGINWYVFAILAIALLWYVSLIAKVV